MRILVRLLFLFARALRQGNPYAQAALVLVVAASLLGGLLWFARRPLGGDPDKPPIDDASFPDEKNPYRTMT